MQLKEIKEDGDCGDENVDFYFGWVESEGITGHLDANVLLNKKKRFKSEISGLRYGMEIIRFHQYDLKVINGNESYRETMEMPVTTQATLFGLYLMVREHFPSAF